MKIIKEACVENFNEALEAQNRGANRIELCENLNVGGTTPSYGTTLACLKHLDIPIFPMVRPRGGNFVYSPIEIEIMKNDIKLFKNMGIKGVVFGVLLQNGDIDIKTTKELVDLARPMVVTFHKAIDETNNPIYWAEELSKIGVKRILTSGGKATALEGKDIINEMIKKDIQIVVAGKVASDNFETILKLIPNNEYHGKKIVWD